jgi:hypothetical protein
MAARHSWFQYTDMNTVVFVPATYKSQAEVAGGPREQLQAMEKTTLSSPGLSF